MELTSVTGRVRKPHGVFRALLSDITALLHATKQMKRSFEQIDLKEGSILMNAKGISNWNGYVYLHKEKN
jgi:hypothetical protein